MKNQKSLTSRQSMRVQSVPFGWKKSQQEEMGEVVLDCGRTVSSRQQFICAAEMSKPEMLWRADAVMVLPEQFFCPSNESFAVWTGERRLLLAVLEEAVTSFLRYRNST